MDRREKSSCLPEQLTVGGVTIHKHERYSAYPAARCRETGLPLVCKEDRKPGGLVENLQTAGERKKSGYPVKDGEEPKAWSRVANGYIPLYEKVPEKEGEST